MWPEVELTYTINFQNTGTAPAQNIFIIDSLSDLLDHSTIKIIGSSHPVQTTYLPDWPMRFDFKNIILPDSNSNEPASHGWVMFNCSVQEDLLHGDRIENFVDIFFDYNLPIRTNTAFVTIDTGYYPKLSTHTSPNLCVSNDIGSASALVDKGASDYGLVWSNGSKENNINNVASGTYTVTLQDDNLYTIRQSAEVIDNRSIDVYPGLIDGTAYPEAGDTIEYLVVLDEALTYYWSVVGGLIVGQNQNVAQIIWGDTSHGKIVVNATDNNNCTSFATQSVSITPSDIAEANDTKITVLPNPAHESVTISSPTLFDKIELIDINGRIVISENPSELETKLSISHLPNGAYTIRCSNTSKAYTQSVIFE